MTMAEKKKEIQRGRILHTVKKDGGLKTRAHGKKKRGSAHPAHRKRKGIRVKLKKADNPEKRIVEKKVQTEGEGRSLFKLSRGKQGQNDGIKDLGRERIVCFRSKGRRSEITAKAEHSMLKGEEGYNWPQKKKTDD